MTAKQADETQYEGRLQKYSDSLWIFQFLDLPHVFGLSTTQSEAFSKAQSNLLNWITLAKKDGLVIPRPGEHKRYSGKIKLRLPRSLQYRLTRLAFKLNLSCNQLAKQMVEFGLGQMDALDSFTRTQITRAESEYFTPSNSKSNTKSTFDGPLNFLPTDQYKGIWLLRLDPATHLHIACTSKSEGVSANTFIITLLSLEVGKWETAPLDPVLNRSKLRQKLAA